jgi:hypothetical protein
MPGARAAERVPPGPSPRQQCTAPRVAGMAFHVKPRWESGRKRQPTDDCRRTGNADSGGLLLGPVGVPPAGGAGFRRPAADATGGADTGPSCSRAGREHRCFTWNTGFRSGRPEALTTVLRAAAKRRRSSLSGPGRPAGTRSRRNVSRETAQRAGAGARPFPADAPAQGELPALF